MSAVSLSDVKRHLNITGTQNDAELPTFIDTAQQMVEGFVGPVEVRGVTETAFTSGDFFVSAEPVASITSITEYGTLVSPSAYVLDTVTGQVRRLDGRRWYASVIFPLTVVASVGRASVPEPLKWAIMELTQHLWRSSQAQRGGQSRGEGVGPAAFGVPNRVRDAMAPFLLIPAVG